MNTQVLIPPIVQTISDRLCIVNQKIFINKMWLFVWTNCVCWIKAALFIEEELPITGYNLKKMGFWGKNLFPTRWMYLGYNMISMTTLFLSKSSREAFSCFTSKIKWVVKISIFRHEFVKDFVNHLTVFWYLSLKGKTCSLKSWCNVMDKVL